LVVPVERVTAAVPVKVACVLAPHGPEVMNRLLIDVAFMRTPAGLSSYSRFPVGVVFPFPCMTKPKLACELGLATLGTSAGTDLRGAGVRPVRLRLAHRLVYSAHDYWWDHSSAARVRADLGARWGCLLIQHRWWTTPVLVGEYGSCHPDEASCTEASWFAAVRQYLAAADLDWTYWAVNGTGSSALVDPTTCTATPRAPGCIEPYGVADPAWAGDASPALSADLRALEPQTQSP